MAQDVDQTATKEHEDVMPLLGIDHVEYYVGNARQAAYYYSKAFGFTVTGYSGPETKVRDRASWVLEQGEARFVVTGAMGPEGPIAKHVRQHGDGVRDVALRVPDATYAYEHATKQGARGVLEPTVLEDENGKVIRSAIAAYGETLHSFIERENYSGPFLPGYRSEASIPDDGPEVGIQLIDHVVCNVELGKMNEWAQFYRKVLGFDQLVHFRDDQISSEYTALMSKVMWDGVGRVKLPINEPAPGKKKSQIEEYIQFYRGPGVQHIALLTEDIVSTVDAQRTVEALRKEFAQDLAHHKVEHITVDSNIAIVAVVGENMRGTPGIAGRTFNALGRENVNLIAIAQGSSESNISFVIDEKSVKTALNTTHREFGLDASPS